jgi:DNA-binding NarL/FixJ family response regulator
VRHDEEQLAGSGPHAEFFIRACALPGEHEARFLRALAGIVRLTCREREVFDRIGIGMSNRLIARDLGVVERTVKSHVSQIIIKLGIEGRAEAAILSLSCRFARHQSAPSKVQ